VRASRGDQSITVSWSEPDTNNGSEVTGYDVYCATGAPNTASTPAASTDAVTTSATISGLSAHTTYNCLVTAVNAAGQSGPSDLASAAPFEVPDAPTGISTTAGNHQVTVFWSRPTDVGGTPITGYRVYCSATFPPTVDAGDLCGTFAPSMRSGIIRRLVNQHTVYVGVTAINQAGESALSGVGAPTPTGPPSPPIGVLVTPRRGLLAIRWRVPNSGGQPITSYTAVCDVGLPVPGVSPSQSTTTNHIAFTGLTSGTLYYCVVVANNQNGPSAPSGVVSGTPR
jgi:titin